MFKKMYDRYFEIIEGFIMDLPWSEDTMGKSMRYSLVSGGKRIRPVLALAAAECVGGNIADVLPAAAALEFIHTYSLIHDDLPSMDNDDYRRGKLTNHKVFGEGFAVLAGDGLLTYAFEMLSSKMNFPAELQLTVLNEVAVAVGKVGMVGGQVLDLEGEGKELTLPEIENINKNKTGALLIVSTRLGAILAGGNEAQVDALTRYARAVGLAFQIKDDILDIEGNSEILGKTIGSDHKQGKTTYPALMGLEEAKEYLHTQTMKAKEALEIFGERGLFLTQLADYMENRQH
ncbi:MAG: polyprenyl synthetase family protein [Desulfitobacteriaceae bacterium]|nr:polyprenyl synthetase family protein [Desulfitobacteriaceae bacterium]MDD4346120.1 polyprenyl synthetase family protein [Desulfitobacteriaceae bacterium]MDD4401080.1 polyprenyl synthetase family protein [Desulfitobacteriaceae bacterium]